LKLKAKLEARAVCRERKRPLPHHPRAIAIVTSLQGGGVAHVLTRFGRAPHVRSSTGAGAGRGVAAKLAAMVDEASARREVDVLIVCRGGGSMKTCGH